MLGQSRKLSTIIPPTKPKNSNAEAGKTDDGLFVVASTEATPQSHEPLVSEMNLVATDVVLGPQGLLRYMYRLAAGACQLFDFIS